MSRALYVSAFVPDANGQHAGARVAYENLSQLRAAYGTVDALACTTERATSAPEGVHVIRHRLRHLLSYLFAQATSLGPRAILCAPVVHTRLSTPANRWLSDRLGAQAYDCVFVDFTQVALLVQRALEATGNRRVPVTVCLHDVFAQRLLRTPGWWSSLIAGPALREEQGLVDAAARILTLSDKDRGLLQSLYAAASVDVKPFVAPAWCGRVVRRAERIDRGLLLFFGNFNRSENQLAARWFLAEAWDPVVRAAPGVSLKLVGASSDTFAQRLRHPQVSGTGFVSDPSDWFEQCAIAIAPLAQGAGVKFKVLEALACKVPVLGTPVACEGVEDQPLLVRATRAEFADRLIELLDRALVA